MYEAEVNRLTEKIESLPGDVVRQFSELSDRIVGRTLLPWGEHCTECNWPSCYKSCELYTRREDGACRLFTEGMVRLDNEGGAHPYLLKICFKRWGKLWTVGNVHLYDMGEARRREKANIRVGALSRSVPLTGVLKEKLLQKVAYRRRVTAEGALPSEVLPDFFVIECYNPNKKAMSLTLSIRFRHDKSQPAFQKNVEVKPGFNRAMVGTSEISPIVDLREAFEVEIVPNDCDDTTLFFGVIDFVKVAMLPTSLSSAPAGKKVKCIVWDLDNTLWDGTLIEDGLAGLRLRQDIVELIREMDRRGILHSIASKNDPEEAMKALKVFGLEDYFLCPQIHWQPKSQSVARIAELLNIGVDSLAFVDDQPFEREEVATTLPIVAALDPSECKSLSNRPECIVPVTEESRNRRSMYRQQEQRSEILSSFKGDYTGFLKECNIRLELDRLNEGNVERVYELAQRTNQMNFSGSRYARDDLQKLMHSASHDTFVMRCTDRFGSYGTVGFAVVETAEPRLLDLMFSCRIQAKRIEHAFLKYLLRRYASPGLRDFFANYKKTPKNQASGKVFADVHFEEAGETAGVTSLVFRSTDPIQDDQVVAITDDALSGVLQKAG